MLFRSSEAAVLHPDDGLPGLPDAVEDLLVLDAQLGVVLGVVGFVGALGVVILVLRLVVAYSTCSSNRAPRFP